MKDRIKDLILPLLFVLLLAALFFLPMMARAEVKPNGTSRAAAMESGLEVRTRVCLVNICEEKGPAPAVA